MSIPLLNWAPPSVTRLVVAWLQPLGTSGALRPQTAVLPYRMVTTVGGDETCDKTMQKAVVSVHTFDVSMDAAESSAQLTHQRMLLMGPPLAPPQLITYTINGNSVSATPHSVTTHHIPQWQDYQDDLIFRFVARYDVWARFQ